MTKTSRGKGCERRKLVDVVVDVRNRSGVDDWMRDLRLRYSVQEEPAANETAIFFDTFDGRLFDKGLACAKTGTSVRLFSFETHGKDASGAVDPLPRFAAEFPEGKLRDHLLPIVKNRALLEVLRTATDRRSWRILNSDQKTVARVLMEHIEARDDTQSAHLGPFLCLKPVRGYGRIAEDMERWIDERGLPKLTGAVYLRALAALDKNLERDVQGLRPGLEDSMPAAEAVRVLLRSLYEIVRVNESGVRADTDTEFLHDYRVAVRKARSLMGQTRGVFAPGPTARFRKSLKWLGRSTNALRDLDVYLLHRSRYESWLGAPLDRAIEPLFAYLRSARDKAFQEFAVVMNSQEYANVRSSWSALVEDPGFLGVGRKGTKPIEKVARSRLAKKCRQVLEQGYGLTDATAPEALHALRIECKHLRYLVEFFLDFVPESKHLIQRMKKLQDALGAIQDLTVQEQRLQHYLEGPQIRNESPASAATQELIMRVREERDSEQARVLKLFARFSRSLGESDPPYSILLPWLRTT